ncbi:MAG: hypothetical protein ABI847_16155, partial [Anaerolineales bacterium]
TNLSRLSLKHSLLGCGTSRLAAFTRCDHMTVSSIRASPYLWPIAMWMGRKSKSNSRECANLRIARPY